MDGRTYYHGTRLNVAMNGEENTDGGSNRAEPGRAGGDAPTDAEDPGALAERLRRAREPFATATVVRREPPVSTTVGDSAVATRDGELHGWIGGLSCAQSAVTEEALAAIADGESRLVGIAPEPDAIDRPGLSAHPMKCHSEGTLEVFVEPVRPTARIVVVGATPVANSLRRLATELPFEIVTVDPSAESGRAAESPAGSDDVEGRPTDTTDELTDADPVQEAADGTVLATSDPDAIEALIDDRTLVVAASMGECDPEGVAAGVSARAPYVGLVASEKRAARVTERAAALLDADQGDVRERVTSPAGLDIDAGSPAEIAVSVLAELVAVANGDAFRSGEDESAAEESGGFCESEDAGADRADGSESDNSKSESPESGSNATPSETV
ncbi:XdhC family protein [Halobacteria archaeon AArc-dxtr1]|nr:XdhC family protein [Halobacteria archaeon AArc-dxtr1]